MVACDLLRHVGNGITFVCELAAFVFWDLLVFGGFECLVGGRGRADGGWAWTMFVFTPGF
jgi:hypothetical protein